MASATNEGEFFGVHAKKVGPPPSFNPRPLRTSASSVEPERGQPATNSVESG